MNLSIRSKIIKIGNSRGIRIPRTVIEQAGFSDEVEMTLQGDKLVITSARKPRQNWSAAFAAMSKQKDDHLLDKFLGTQWDEEEWTW